MISNRIKIITLTCLNIFFFNLTGNVRDTLKKEKFTVSVGTGYSIGLIENLGDKRIKFVNESIPYRGDVGLNILLRYKKILFGIDVFHYSLFKYEYTGLKYCYYSGYNNYFICRMDSGNYISKDGKRTGLFYKKYRISMGAVLMDKRKFMAGFLMGFNSRTYDAVGILIKNNELGRKYTYTLDFYYFFNVWINVKFPRYKRINLILKYENLLSKLEGTGRYDVGHYYTFNNLGFTFTFKIINKYEK